MSRWKSFSEIPPADEFIDVYAEDEQGVFWIYQCKWRSGGGGWLEEISLNVVELNGARALCWRPRHPLPRESDLIRFRSEPPQRGTVAKDKPL